MAAKSGFLKQGASDKMWNGCPTLDQPEYCYGIVDHFLEFSYADATARWTVDNDTATAVLGSAETVGLGGVLVLAGAADDKWINVKLTTADTGAPFKITKDSGKKLWFGIRLKNTAIVESCIYAGLCDEATLEPGADTTGAENFAADGVYWRSLLNATKGDWDAAATQNGTEAEVGGDLVTSDTSWHTFGITFNGANLVQFWADDVVKASVATDATVFPDDQGLTPFFFMKCGETASKAVHVDWIKCVQLV